MNPKLEKTTEQDKKEEELRNYYITDKPLGSQCIADYLIDKFHLKTTGERTRDIYLYKNGIYILGANILRGEIQRILGSIVSKHHKNEIIEKIKDSTITNRKEFNPSRDLVNLNNGVLDIRTGKKTDHNPNNLFFSKIPVDYKEGIDCPKVKKFLSEILGKDD